MCKVWCPETFVLAFFFFFFLCSADHRDLHVLTHSFPTRRSSDLFGNALRVTGNTSYLDVLLKGTESLSARFDPEVGCIRSWGKSDINNDFLVIIDNMMNLDMMTWASRVGGNDKYRDIAVTHANTTMANHFRPDFSSYHVVNYNQQDGSVLQKKTAQGDSDSSAWARGQAWGLYGYTMMGRETGKKEYLELARERKSGGWGKSVVVRVER